VEGEGCWLLEKWRWKEELSSLGCSWASGYVKRKRKSECSRVIAYRVLSI
jgi:hypothetical protein